MSALDNFIAEVSQKLGVTVLGPVVAAVNETPSKKMDAAIGIEIIHDEDELLNRLPGTEGHSIIRISIVHENGESLVFTSTVNRDELRKLLDA